MPRYRRHSLRCCRHTTTPMKSLPCIVMAAAKAVLKSAVPSPSASGNECLPTRFMEPQLSRRVAERRVADKEERLEACCRGVAVDRRDVDPIVIGVDKAANQIAVGNRSVGKCRVDEPVGTAAAV